MIKQNLLKITYSLIAAIILTIEILFCWNYFKLWINIILASVNYLILVISFVGIYKKSQSIYRSSLLTSYVIAICLLIYSILIYSGFLKQFENIYDFIFFVNNSHGTAEIIFVLFQIAQVTLIPIPSAIITIAGGILFGFWKGVLLTSIGLIIGSMIAFAIGKIFGVKLVEWIIGKESFEKYNNYMKGRDKLLIVFMLFFPFFPDDFLCLLAGLTNMKYSTFFVIMLILRPLNTVLTVLFSNNMALIPFEGYGIAIWITIALITILLLFLIWKFGDKIEKKLISLFDKILIKFNLSKKNKSSNIINEKETKKLKVSENFNKLAEFETAEDLDATKNDREQLKTHNTEK